MQSVVINGVQYNDVPEIDIPTQGGGTAKFVETSDANAAAADALYGKTFYVNGTKITSYAPSIQTAHRKPRRTPKQQPREKTRPAMQ